MSDIDEELGSNLLPDKPKRTARNVKAATDDPYDERVWIVLEDSKEIPETGLPLGVNGDICLVLPAIPVHLQKKYIEVLDNAIMSTPVLDKADRVVGYRERHRFPYRLATPKEIAQRTEAA